MKKIKCVINSLADASSKVSFCVSNKVQERIGLMRRIFLQLMFRFSSISSFFMAHSQTSLKVIKIYESFK